MSVREGRRACNSLQANPLAKPVKKWSTEGTSEVIWSNPLVFQKPRNLGVVPMTYKRMFRKHI